MTMRDRLAADLCKSGIGCAPHGDLMHGRDADRLIALGWVRLDEEALARALATYEPLPSRAGGGWRRADPGDAAAIIRALREER